MTRHCSVHLLDVAAVVGAVGDSVAGDIHSSGHPAHPQHTVRDHRELNAHWWWDVYWWVVKYKGRKEDDKCGERQMICWRVEVIPLLTEGDDSE